MMPVSFKSVFRLSSEICGNDTATGFQNTHAPLESPPWDHAEGTPVAIGLCLGLVVPPPQPASPPFPASHILVLSFLGTWALFSFCTSVGTSSAVGTGHHRGWRREESSCHPARPTIPGAGGGTTHSRCPRARLMTRERIRVSCHTCRQLLGDSGWEALL